MHTCQRRSSAFRRRMKCSDVCGRLDFARHHGLRTRLASRGFIEESGVLNRRDAEKGESFLKRIVPSDFPGGSALKLLQLFNNESAKASEFVLAMTRS